MALPQPTLLDRFVALCGEERRWGQVLLRRQGDTFELRHVEDRGLPAEGLRDARVEDLRAIAEVDVRGGFRPLKSAPSLIRGWRCRVAGPAGLREAMDHLYPGGLADWWAALNGRGQATDFPAMAARQQGKARIIQSLRGPQLAATINAMCGPAGCVRHRRWQAPEVPADDGYGKSPMPCLEACPLLLGFARTCAAIEQSSSVPVELAPEDLATVVAALRHALEHPLAELREGDFAEPLHPRRVARLLERHVETWSKRATPEAHTHADL